jgi:hypothetical protein
MQLVGFTSKTCRGENGGQLGTGPSIMFETIIDAYRSQDLPEAHKN